MINICWENKPRTFGYKKNFEAYWQMDWWVTEWESKQTKKFGGRCNRKARWFFWRNNIEGKFGQYGEGAQGLSRWKTWSTKLWGIMQILKTKYNANIEDKILCKYWRQKIMQILKSKHYANMGEKILCKYIEEEKKSSLNLLLSNKWKIKCFPMGMITDHTKCCANIGFSEQMKWGLQ